MSLARKLPDLVLPVTANWRQAVRDRLHAAWPEWCDAHDIFADVEMLIPLEIATRVGAYRRKRALGVPEARWVAFLDYLGQLYVERQRSTRTRAGVSLKIRAIERYCPVCGNRCVAQRRRTTCSARCAARQRPGRR